MKKKTKIAFEKLKQSGEFSDVEISVHPTNGSCCITVVYRGKKYCFDEYYHGHQDPTAEIIARVTTAHVCPW